MELFYYVFLYFLIYSILGWFCEVVYCYMTSKKLTNRGFLDGPYCPIYGFGGLVVVYILKPISQNYILVFFLGIIATTILEYITSVIMEKIFNTRWWDYSNHKFNINGRVCLVNSILFGILSLITMYILHPFVINIITKIPPNIVGIVVLPLIVIVTVDVVTTIITMINLKKRLEKIKLLKEELDMKLSEITQKDLIPIVTEILHMQIRDLIAEKRFFEKRLLNAFPKIKSKKFSEQFKALKETIEKEKRKSKKQKKTCN